ncbi:MAG: diphosphomevalonate decarboxylase [bacterium]
MTRSRPLPRACTATAGVNFALVKYWGKRDAALNLPAVGSISMTLAAPGTTTTVAFDPALATDAFTLDGRALADAGVFAVLDAVRAVAGVDLRARVDSRNTVATASGLASSASGMAALGLAAWGAAGLAVDQPAAQPALVEIVRRGSGSAPRSLLGGLVELRVDDASVHPLASPDAWPLAIVVARVGHGEKKVKSRPGMTHTAETSPYYAPWIAAHPADLAAARAAIAARDLPALGAVMERSTLRMHACMWAADPPLRYLRGRTLDLMDAVEALRDAGVGAWYTMDAGPHVKVLCAAADASGVAAALATVPGLASVEICQPGPGATAEVLP